MLRYHGETCSDCFPLTLLARLDVLTLAVPVFVAWIAR